MALKENTKPQNVIKAFETQCWEYHNGQTVFNSAKFAELIIQECSDLNSCLVEDIDMLDKAYCEHFDVVVGE